MKSNKKYFCLGVVVGAIVFGGALSFADSLLSVTPNPFKIKVDGVEKNIEGYNINDNSYFKLRDIGEQVGFDVGFEGGVIMINAQYKEETNDDNQTEKDTVQLINDYTFSKNDKIYIFANSLNSFFQDPPISKKIYLGAETINDKKYLYIYEQSTNKKLTESIPYIIFDNSCSISEDDFNCIVMPVIEEIIGVDNSIELKNNIF